MGGIVKFAIFILLMGGMIVVLGAGLWLCAVLIAASPFGKRRERNRLASADERIRQVFPGKTDPNPAPPDFRD